MNKKKILLGIVGQYRTFEKTYNNIYENLILNNPNYEFEIVLNTDFINEDIIDPWNKPKISIDYNKNQLIDKFNYCYGKNLKKIINYNITEYDKKSGAFEIFNKRIKIICNEIKNLDSKYCLYIFIRFDIIFSGKINVNEYMNNSFNFICGSISNTTRIDHHRDWDFCWIFSDLKYFNFFNRDFDNTFKFIENITVSELIDFSYKINYKTDYIPQIKEQNILINGWVKNFWIRFYNMYLNNCIVNYSESIFADIVR